MKAEELWKKHSQTLPMNIGLLEAYAGASIITRNDFMEAYKAHVSKMPSDRCNHQYVKAQNIEFKDGSKLEKAMVCVLCRKLKNHLAKPTKKP